jgi:hypothetical protein
MRLVAPSRPLSHGCWGVKLLVYTVCGTLLVTISRATALSAADTEPTSASWGDLSGVTWRGARYGGLNCLLLLFYLHGNKTEYSDCVRSIGIGSTPNTGAEILRAAKRLNFPLEARTISPEELETVHLPVIVHIDGDGPTEGLFCVLLGGNPSRVHLMEGPGAIVVGMDKEVFLRRWTGVIMYPKRWRLLGTPTCVALSLVISFVLAWGMPRRSKRSWSAVLLSGKYFRIRRVPMIARDQPGSSG